MNSSLDLVKALAENFPSLKIEVDNADTPDGITWIDLHHGANSYTIEVKPNDGFGLYYLEEEGIGSRPDEIYREMPILLLRIQKLLSPSGSDSEIDSGNQSSSLPHQSPALPDFPIRKVKGRGIRTYGTRKYQDRKALSMTLKDIRELLGITQSQVAVALGKQQSSISKIEQREDVLISTLASLIHSLGGQLEIKAHFKDCELPIYRERRVRSVATEGKTQRVG